LLRDVGAGRSAALVGNVPGGGKITPADVVFGRDVDSRDRGDLWLVAVKCKDQSVACPGGGKKGFEKVFVTAAP